MISSKSWIVSNVSNFPYRFAPKLMKSGLGKNGGGGTGVPPPRTPFVMPNSYPTLPKNFWKNLSIFVDRTKNIFGQIVFRPNIQALEKKMLLKWQFSFYPFCIGRKLPKCFKTILGECLTLYSSNQGFVRIKNQKWFRKMNFCKISPILPQKCC